MQSHNDRPFVVSYTATDQVAILARNLERRKRPSGTSGHDVHMADDADLGIAFTAHVGIADAALAIVCLETHALSYVKRSR